MGTRVGGDVELRGLVEAYCGRKTWRARRLGREGPIEVTVLDARLGPRDSRRVLQFHGRAKLFEQLRSAHVARLYGHGLSAERQPFVIHEPLGGMRLADRLTRRGRLSLRDTSRVLLQLTSAYGEAHEIGLVMGALSPHDVWLLPADELLVKLTATGMVREALDDWDDHTLRAPELRAGGTVDRRADLWALAALTHLALTGRPPRSPRASGVVPCLTQASDVRMWPRALDDWFRLALSPYPEWRFGSAEEMATTWSAALDSVDEGAICFDDEVVLGEALVG